jgi:hypothetical protein
MIGSEPYGSRATTCDGVKVYVPRLDSVRALASAVSFAKGHDAFTHPIRAPPRNDACTTTELP